MKRILLIAILLILINASFASALDTKTHQALNEYISTLSFEKFSLDSTLTGIGLQGGIKEPFELDGKPYKVYELIGIGGKYEDIPAWYMPYLRSKNHFHNPVNNAGFSGIAESGLLAGVSAVDWANQPMNTQSPGGYYSWKDVRNYYFLALTSADKETRDSYFAQTFRGVGQLMHLVQDMSVPEHTRDDGHYWLFPVWLEYEQWVKEKVNVSSLSPVFYSGQLSSINALFDSGQYDGTNPDVTLNTGIGLSEYTNANFLSWDTMFTGFAHPSVDSVELWQDASNKKKYLRKPGNGQKVDHLAQVSYWYSYRMRYFPQEKQYLPLGMDETVYSDYASLLLPRAIGYSAGLMKYFFRGEIDMAADKTNSGKYKIKNDYDEAMAGTFSLYYDDKDDNRIFVKSWNTGIAAKSESEPLNGFTEPTDPEPEEKGKYVLVFQGELGAEKEAVAGKEVSFEKDVTIVFRSATKGYKTVNLKTKEVKDYSGIFATTGRIYWRPDGKAFMALYNNWWCLVDVATGGKTSIMEGYRYAAVGGWKGNTAVMFGIDRYSSNKAVYWDSDSGKRVEYTTPSVSLSRYIGYYSGPLNKVRNMAISEDGETVTYIGESYPDYVLISFNTTSRSFTTVKAGEMGKWTNGPIQNVCDRFVYSPQTYTEVDPIAVGYAGNALEVLSHKAEYQYEFIKGDWNPKYSCYKYGGQAGTGLNTYDVLGQTIMEGKTWNGGYSYSVSNVLYYPLEYVVLGDGGNVIPFIKDDVSYLVNSPPQSAARKVTSCVYLNGEHCQASPLEMQRQSTSQINLTGGWSMVNTNYSKDQAAGLIQMALSGSYPSETMSTRTVFYVSDGKFTDITNIVPEIGDADFVAIIDE